MTDEPPGLGIHILTGEHLKRLLWLVHEGEHPEVTYMTLYANATHVSTEGDEDE